MSLCRSKILELVDKGQILELIIGFIEEDCNAFDLARILQEVFQQLTERDNAIVADNLLDEQKLQELRLLFNELSMEQIQETVNTTLEKYGKRKKVQ